MNISAEYSYRRHPLPGKDHWVPKAHKLGEGQWKVPSRKDLPLDSPEALSLGSGEAEPEQEVEQTERKPLEWIPRRV